MLASRIARQSTIALRAALFLFFAVAMPVHFYLLYKVPRAPLKYDLTGGFIYPINNNGVIHYLNRFDHVLDIATPVMFVVLFIAIVFFYFRRRNHTNSETVAE